MSRVVLVTGGSHAASASPARSASPRSATRSPSPTTRSPPPDGLLRRAVRRHRPPTSVDAAFAAVEDAVRARRGARVQRRHHQRRPAAADERGRLHLGHRRQPHRRLPRRQAGRAGHAARPQGPHHPHVVGGRPARLGRPGELRGVEGRPRRASPARSPASWARAASPSTSSPPARSPPT